MESMRDIDRVMDADKPKTKKKGMSKKVCPNCGGKMKNRPDGRDDLQLYRLAAL